MNNQEVLNQLAERLQAADPKYQAALDLLTYNHQMPTPPVDIVPRLVIGWPDGAVRGLLEFDLLKALGLKLYQWGYGVDYQPRVNIIKGDGGRGDWHGEGATEVEALGQAILEALK